MRKPRSTPKPKKRRWPRVLDITREIAISKAMTRVHGPFLQTCTACGERFWPDKKEEHLARCHPPPAHIQPAAASNTQPLRPRVRPNQYRPTPKPQSLLQAEANVLALVRAKGKKTCPFCGKTKKDLRVHMLAKHRGQGFRNLSAPEGTVARQKTKEAKTASREPGLNNDTTPD
jgi:hypothetical protein